MHGSRFKWAIHSTFSGLSLRWIEKTFERVDVKRAFLCDFWVRTGLIIWCSRLRRYINELFVAIFRVGNGLLMDWARIALLILHLESWLIATYTMKLPAEASFINCHFPNKNCLNKSYAVLLIEISSLSNFRSDLRVICTQMSPHFLLWREQLLLETVLHCRLTTCAHQKWFQSDLQWRIRHRGDVHLVPLEYSAEYLFIRNTNAAAQHFLCFQGHSTNVYPGRSRIRNYHQGDNHLWIDEH